MKGFIDNLFTRESGIRHLKMLLLTVVVQIWVYVAFSLLGRDWSWPLYNSENVGSILNYISLIGVLVGLCGCIGVAFYWNIAIWMWSFLLKGVVYLFGWLPVVRRLTPEYHESVAYKRWKVRVLRFRALRYPLRSKERREIKEAIKNLKFWIKRQKESEARIRDAKRRAWDKAQKEYESRKTLGTMLTRMWDEEDGYYYDDEHYYGEMPDVDYSEADMLQYSHDKIYGYDPEKNNGGKKHDKESSEIPKYLQFKDHVSPLAPRMKDETIVTRLLKGIGYLLGSIAVPVFSPLIITILMTVILSVSGKHTVVLAAIAGALVLPNLLLYVVHPIVSLIHDRKKRDGAINCSLKV